VKTAAPTGSPTAAPLSVPNNGLVLHLDANTYDGTGYWKSMVKGKTAYKPPPEQNKNYWKNDGSLTSEKIPNNAAFSGSGDEKFFALSTTAIMVPMMTNPAQMPFVTYVMRLRVKTKPNSFGWVMAQGQRDYGWSRALTINDHRVPSNKGGDMYLGQTPGNYDDVDMVQIPNAINLNTWHVLVGVYDGRNGPCRVYIDGKGGSTDHICNNGGSDGANDEKVIIGGGPGDGGYNPGNIDISHVLVYDRALTQNEISTLKDAMEGTATSN